MVFQNKPCTTDAAYVDTTASVKSSATASKAKMLADYFATLDGSPEGAERFPHAFAATFHPDGLIELPGSSLDYAAAVECIQAGLGKGASAKLLNIAENEDDTITITVQNDAPGLKDDITHQVVYFQGGKVIKVHAIESDAAQFGKMVGAWQRCVPANAKDEAVAERYAEMIACFNGRPDAYAKALPIIDEIFSPELSISTGGDLKDLQWFKEWAKTYGAQRNVARLDRLEPTADGIRVVITNIVNGTDQGGVAQLGRIEDGKITYWSADSNNEAGFDRLVTSVEEK